MALSFFSFFSFVLVTGEKGKEQIEKAHRPRSSSAQKFPWFLSRASRQGEVPSRRQLPRLRGQESEKSEKCEKGRMRRARAEPRGGGMRGSLSRKKNNSPAPPRRRFALFLSAASRACAQPRSSKTRKEMKKTKKKKRPPPKKESSNLLLTPSAPRLRAVITAFDGARYMKKEMIVPATGTTLPRRTPGMVTR